MTRVHGALAILASVLGLAAAVADAGSADVNRLAADIAAERDHISAPDLADRLMQQDPSLRVIDLRSQAEYDAFHIPTATRSTLESLMRTPFPGGVSVVLYSEGGRTRRRRGCCCGCVACAT